MSSYEAVGVISETLRAEVVVASSLRLRPTPDEQLALHIIAALEAAGYEIRRKSKSAEIRETS